MNKYILTLSEKQAHTVIIALQEFAALRNNNWTDFLTEMCTDKAKVDDAVKAFKEIMSAACDGNTDWNKKDLDLAQNILTKITVGDVILTKDELAFIKDILEEYFRIRLNQWFDFTTDVATAGYVYDKSNPNNNKLFDEYIKRRNEAYDKFTAALGRIHLWNTEQSPEMKCSQDIWQVIRHRLYIDRGGDPNGWCVDARTPMSVSGEKLPELRSKKS